MNYNYNARQFSSRNNLLEERNIGTYQDFLKSDFWKNVKISLRQKEFYNSCNCCGSKEKIQLHHIKYKNFLDISSLKNIFPLCGDCHLKVHNISREQNISFKHAMKKIRKANKFTVVTKKRQKGDLKKYAFIKSEGEVCKKCNCIMQRRARVGKPAREVKYYFTEWDYCTNCGYLQMYEKFKVMW